ncbi:MAG TPA: phosphotransferase [Gaiellaceae bacterium]
MRAAPDELDVSAVLAALRDDWALAAAEVEYAPVGGGSYHWCVVDEGGRRVFVTVDDLDQKTWLGGTREESFGGLRDAFETAAELAGRGLSFVVAPLRTRGGALLVRLDDRYSLAVFPFVDGDPGAWGGYKTDADRLAVVALVADVHRAPVGARSVGLELSGREHLEAALRDLGLPWTGGPHAEPTREAMRAAAPTLVDLLALADRLRAEAEAQGVRSVVTHGEPHSGNIVRTSSGPVLVDWDTVALAPPERDLWMLAGDGMEERYGLPVNAAALEYFRLSWDLKDLAEYLNVLRGPHTDNVDTRAWVGFVERFPAIRDDWF